MKWAVALGLLATAGIAMAHDHHMDEIPPGEAISAEPLDSILWTHIMMMTTAFGLIFPFGMVLGMIKSRWHVPVQVVGTCVAVLAYFLGHAHKGRQFAPNIHASFASSLMTMLFFQVVFGIYLKLHLERGIHGKVRKYVVMAHGILGKSMPIVAWIQMLFGGITALGFCRSKGDHTGQCLAHFIMGSSFIAYGIVMNIILIGGQMWLRRTGKSQEFWDSLIIAAWGCVNTFTEHRWGQAWAHNDIQHTSMGVVWWCAGLLGLYLSRSKEGRPRRNLIPAIVIFLTGYAMSAHPQHLPLSSAVHTAFGYTLMGAGLTRGIEIAFILRDRPFLSGGNISSFQYLPSFLLYASGFIFMSATEEQMALIATAGMDHVSYLLVLYSVAFIMYLVTVALINLYASNATPAATKEGPRGGALANGRTRSRSRDPERQVQDAAEFELEGLIHEEPVTPDSPSAPRSKEF